MPSVKPAAQARRRARERRAALHAGRAAQDARIESATADALTLLGKQAEVEAALAEAMRTLQKEQLGAGDIAVLLELPEPQVRRLLSHQRTSTSTDPSSTAEPAAKPASGAEPHQLAADLAPKSA